MAVPVELRILLAAVLSCYCDCNFSAADMVDLSMFRFDSFRHSFLAVIAVIAGMAMVVASPGGARLHALQEAATEPGFQFAWSRLPTRSMSDVISLADGSMMAISEADGYTFVEVDGSGSGLMSTEFSRMEGGARRYQRVFADPVDPNTKYNSVLSGSGSKKRYALVSR